MNMTELEHIWDLEGKAYILRGTGWVVAEFGSSWECLWNMDTKGNFPTKDEAKAHCIKLMEDWNLR